MLSKYNAWWLWISLDSCFLSNSLWILSAWWYSILNSYLSYNFSLGWKIIAVLVLLFWLLLHLFSCTFCLTTRTINLSAYFLTWMCQGFKAVWELTQFKRGLELIGFNHPVPASRKFSGIAVIESKLLCSYFWFILIATSKNSLHVNSFNGTWTLGL